MDDISAVAIYDCSDQFQLFTAEATPSIGFIWQISNLLGLQQLHCSPLREAIQIDGC
jgi:hypothetical protein